MRNLPPTKPILMAVLILATVASALPVAAITVPLVGLTGDYEFDPYAEPNFGAPGVRSIDFMLPENISGIEGLSLVLSGQWAAGEVSCNHGFEFPEISPILPPVSLFISSDAFPGDFFHASIWVPDGPFENLTADFTSCCPPGVLDFNQLLGSELRGELFIDLAILGICYVTIDTHGTINEVALEVTGTVATDQTSWSSVKSLYR